MLWGRTVAPFASVKAIQAACPALRRCASLVEPPCPHIVVAPITRRFIQSFCVVGGAFTPSRRSLSSARITPLGHGNDHRFRIEKLLRLIAPCRRHDQAAQRVLHGSYTATAGPIVEVVPRPSPTVAPGVPSHTLASARHDGGPRGAPHQRPLASDLREISRLRAAVVRRTPSEPSDRWQPSGHGQADVFAQSAPLDMLELCSVHDALAQHAAHLHAAPGCGHHKKRWGRPRWKSAPRPFRTKPSRECLASGSSAITRQR
jgi:hypothetical protein